MILFITNKEYIIPAPRHVLKTLLCPIRYEDNCGVYWPFEPERNVPVDCNSDESHTPGTFCVKIVKQGPRGFICKHVFYNSKK